MNILLLSSGGGGGNILRSVKTLFRRDLAVAQKSDARYAERLRRAVATRFLDTNEFSLSDVPREERLLIGAGTTRRLGSRHSPELARQALEESRSEVEALFSKYSAVVLIGTGGKGTGAGTIFPLAEMARQQRKIVIPIFVRPSFERHEVEKRRYDHALNVTDQFDAARIRLIEILNDRGYADTAPEPQSVVWERMNRPIARGLRGLLYVLWDLSQVDPSDLSVLFAGQGRLRVGFSEIDPPAGHDPAVAQIDEAVRACWENLFYAFSGPVGTSLVCIQGDWSNVVDATIKGQLAASTWGTSADNPYNPLYARAFHMPRPWGITALFAEYTGNHPPLEVDWTFEKRVALSSAESSSNEPVSVGTRGSAVSPPHDDEVIEPVLAKPGSEKEVETKEHANAAPPPVPRAERAQPATGFRSFWEFALALNRSDPAALALATNGVECAMPLDGLELRRLLGTFWFRSVFARLSQTWRERVLNALVDGVAIPNHALRLGRHGVHLREVSYGQLKEIFTRSSVPEPVRADLQLLMTVANLWGEEALGRFRFVEISPSQEPSRLAVLLQGLRS